MRWSLRRRNGSGRGARSGKGTHGGGETTSMTSVRGGERRTGGGIEMTTGIEIATGIGTTGGGTTTAKTKRSAVAARRRRGGDVNAMMTIMTANARGDMIEMGIVDETGAGSIGGDELLLHQYGCRRLAREQPTYQLVRNQQRDSILYVISSCGRRS